MSFDEVSKIELSNELLEMFMMTSQLEKLSVLF